MSSPQSLKENGDNCNLSEMLQRIPPITRCEFLVNRNQNPRARDFNHVRIDLHAFFCFRRTNKRGKNYWSSALFWPLVFEYLSWARRSSECVLCLSCMVAICISRTQVNCPSIVTLRTTPFSRHRKAVSESAVSFLLKVDMVKLKQEFHLFKRFSKTCWRSKASWDAEHRKLYGNTGTSDIQGQRVSSLLEKQTFPSTSSSAFWLLLVCVVSTLYKIFVQGE